MSVLTLVMTSLAIGQVAPATPLAGAQVDFDKLPKIEGIPKATQLAPLKPNEIELSKAGALVKLIPAEAVAVPLDKDLRNEIKTRIGDVRDQGDRPTGGIHAFTFCAEWVYAKKRNKFNVNFSEEFLNFFTNYVCGNMQDGDIYPNMIRAYMTAGISNESLYPYRTTFSMIPPSAAARSNAISNRAAVLQTIRPHSVGTIPPTNMQGNPPWPVVPGQGMTPQMLELCKSVINFGFPVMVGVRWANEGLVQTQKVFGVELIKIPPMQSAPYGRGIALVGYKNDARFQGGGYFLFRNSQGKDFGHNGYGFMSYLYLRNLGYAAYALR